MIKFNSFSKSYGKNEVLKDLQLEWPNHEIIGLVGRNGSGKSTLFQCIAGLESYHGQVEFDMNTSKLSIGYLATTPYVLSRITGSEYLQLLCNARNITYPEKSESNIFNLPLDEYAQNYSTGMLKKLAITGILHQKNDIYLLDEPFNGLDLESSQAVKTIVLKLKEKGKMVIISSHMLNDLYDLCDQINFIQDKNIIQLKEKARFRDIEELLVSENFNAELNAIL